MNKFGAFGQIRTFGDVRTALERIRAYLQRTSTGRFVEAAGTKNVRDGDITVYQGTSGTVITGSGIRLTDVMKAILATGGYGTVVIFTGATETMTLTGRTIICDRATDMTLNLLPALGLATVYTIKNINTGRVTLVPAGTDTVDDDTTKQELLQASSMVIIDYELGKWAIIGYDW